MILKYIFVVIFFLFMNYLFAQVESNLPPMPDVELNQPDVLPQFPGGDSLMYLFIQENSPYKVFSKAEMKKANSLTFCSFLVNEDGKISNIQILKSSNEEHKNIVLEVVQNMPKWNPAKKDGENISKQIAIVVGLGKKIEKE